MILVRECYDPLLGDDIRYLEPSEWVGRNVIDLVPERVRESEITLQAVRNGVDLTDSTILSTLIEDKDKIILRVIPAVGLAPLTGISAFLLSAWTVGAVVAVGYALQHLINLLLGSPRKPRSDKESASYDFNTPQNTTANGTPISVAYGEVRIAGHILQAKTTTSGLKAFEKFELTVSLLIGLGEGGDAGYERICGETADTVADVTPSDSSGLEINGNLASTYRGITFAVRMGTKNQGILPDFERLVLQVNTLDSVLKYASPVTVTTDNAVDSVEIKVKFPFGLYATRGLAPPSRLDLQPMADWEHDYLIVSFKIRWRPFGETIWRDEREIIITGTRKEPFTVARSFTGLHQTRVQIQVERRFVDEPWLYPLFRLLKPPPSQLDFFHEMRLIEVAEIVNDEIAYVGKALASVKAVATEQLHGSQPNATFLVRGLKMRVYTTPTNYTTRWTRNPSWILLDLLTNVRYGLGDQVKHADCQIQDFIDFAAYCNVVVSDGRGGSEPRCLFDGVIDERRDAWEWIHEVAMTCQAILFISSGKYRVKADAASSPVMMFTPGNMINFSMGYTQPNDRVNYMEITYWDRDLDFRREIVVEVDPEVQELDEYVKESIELVGVTRRSQAHRIATYRINSNKLLTRYFTWMTEVAAVRCEPGDVVEVAHDSVGWGVACGRIESATATTITLDREAVLESGKNYVVRVWQSDGTFETRIVLSSAGTHRTLDLGTSWTLIPSKYQPYSVGEVATVVRQVKVVDMTIKPEMRVEISGTEYNALVYSDTIITLPANPTNLGFDVNEIPPDVTDLRVDQRDELLPDGGVVLSVDVSFTPPSSYVYAGASIWWRLAANSTTNVEWPAVPAISNLKGNFATIRGYFAVGDTIAVAVTAENVFGARKDPFDAPMVRITLVTPTFAPGDVQNFSVNRNGDLLRFSWDAVSSPGILGYEIRQSGASVDWEGGTIFEMDIPGTSYETNAYFAQKVSYTTTFLIKAKNRLGRYSSNATVTTFIIDPRVDHNVIESRNYRDLDWPLGKRTSLELGVGSAGDRNLEIVERMMLGYARWKPVASIFGEDRAGPTLLPVFTNQPAIATRRKRIKRWSWRRRDLAVAAFHRPLEAYYRSPEIDLGVSIRSITAGLVQASQVDPGLDWSTASFSWDSQSAQNRTWAGIIGEKHLTAIPEWRFGAVSPLTNQFKTLTPTDATYRYAQFQARLVLDDPAFDGSLEEFNVTIDVPDTIDHGTGTTDSSGILNVTYNKTFYQLSSIAKEITIKNGATGEYITVSLETLTSFRVTVKNSSNNPVSGRNIEWIAKGY